jgi:hypothetical protein
MASMYTMFSHGESIHFNDLEFIAMSSGELTLSLVVSPIWAINVRRLDIVTDRFGMLHLSSEGGGVI